MATLQELIAQGEHQHQDFKFRIDDQKKIARTLCAFANTNGGRLLIGVKDNGKVAGCDPQEEFHMIEGAAELFCKPKVTFTSNIWQDDYKLVLEIDVPASDLKPHKAPDEDNKWKAYIRVDDRTTAVNKILERVWSEQRKVSSRPEKFSDEELSLLRLIGEFQPVTLSKLYRKSALEMKQVDRLLVLFICWELVEMVFGKENITYKLTESTE